MVSADFTITMSVPGKIISREGEKIKRIDLAHGDLPDPLSITIATLNSRIKFLEDKLLNNKDHPKNEFEILYGEYGGGI